MTACTICNSILDEDDVKMPLKGDKTTHYVCGYTCETVLTDIGIAPPTVAR